MRPSTGNRVNNSGHGADTFKDCSSIVDDSDAGKPTKNGALGLALRRIRPLPDLSNVLTLILIYTIMRTIIVYLDQP